MMGLAYIAAFAVYLLLSITVVKFTLNWARNHNKNAKAWGIVAGLVMYNLVFWDFLPTLALHKYYCATESGFWVYKTAEQWRAEHPDVVVGPIQMPEGMSLDNNGHGEMILPDGTELMYSAEKQLPFGYNERSLSFKKKDGSSGYWLNNRFTRLFSNTKKTFLGVNVHTESIIDGITGTHLLSVTEVSSGVSNRINFWSVFQCGSGADDSFFKLWEKFRFLEGNAK